MAQPSSSKPINVRGLFRWVAVSVLIGLGVILVGGWKILHDSLAQLDGAASVQGLSAPVSVERDSLGVVTITASNRVDASRALGFIHAQERFFQMDQLRRAGAGELAALFGPPVLDMDRRVRIHRPRQLFTAIWEQLPADQRESLTAYAAGVNAGLAALKQRPPEYLLLRAQPEAWKPEDSLAVNLAMKFVLEDAHGESEAHRALLRKLLPDPAFAFFGAPDSGLDAPIDGTELPLPELPRAEDFSWSGWSNRVATAGPPPRDWETEAGVPGSNSWAVDRGATNGPILANDMHLALGVPGIWFRARIQIPGPRGRDVTGFTLPGTPAVVVGSNRHLAWGFTAAGMDVCDLVELEFDPANPRRYRDPLGWSELTTVTEDIVVRGGANVPLRIELTRWGPVIEPPGLGKRYALCWASAHPEASNLRLMELETATDVLDAIAIAPLCGIANNNFLVTGRTSGKDRLAWTLTGRLPDRNGFAGNLPRPWTNQDIGWKGLLPLSQYPRFLQGHLEFQGSSNVPTNSSFGLQQEQAARAESLFAMRRTRILSENPRLAQRHPKGLWTANGRILGSDLYLSQTSPGLQDFGARSGQIRDRLTEMTEPTEAELWDLYRDDRALFLDSWQHRLLATLERGAATNAEWKSALPLVQNWGARAAAESVGYRLVSAFHRSTGALIFEPLVRAGRALNPDFHFRHNTALEILVHERPAHLLNPRFSSYDDLFAAAAEQVFASLREQNIPVTEATWGRRNLLRLQHPLSRAVPALGWLLDLPRVPMSGAPSDMPKIQGADFGPSQRMVVSPGNEERGLCNQPAGQSGHFLSPFYRAGHEAWVKVEPLPFLPGEPRHRLELQPAK